ncbi:PulJ/GspJ family protein [Paracidovorax avenae]|uniref:PulJ/GspJ family protein n=1 Tax=Paracidovorax avenae TaxID=80867 RepID=UPI001CEF9BCA|nr:prepilin-type N-terminal cleavage/methylation domain-containing protein [Paracidovorax avenae]
MAKRADPIPASRHAAGFTLVELLVAIAIMSLLALMSWRGLDGMARAQEQTRARGDELLVLEAALAQWTADLDALQAMDQTTPIDWDGQVLRLTRRGSGTPDEGAYVVAWARRAVNGTDQWLRWQSSPLRTLGEWNTAWQRAALWARSGGAGNAGAERGETVLMPLQDWRLFYYRDGAWYNGLSSSATAPTPQTMGPTAPTNIPDGVRLQIVLPPGRALAGTIIRDWVNPTNGGGKS